MPKDTHLQPVMDKPPIGIVPKYIHDERRLKDLVKAIKRYTEKNLFIDPKWFEEYNVLAEEFQQRNKF